MPQQVRLKRVTTKFIYLVSAMALNRTVKVRRSWRVMLLRRVCGTALGGGLGWRFVMTFASLNCFVWREMWLLGWWWRLLHTPQGRRIGRFYCVHGQLKTNVILLHVVKVVCMTMAAVRLVTRCGLTRGVWCKRFCPKVSAWSLAIC